ncbi:Fur family transcriptional regulator [Nocardioides plantarum]
MDGEAARLGRRTIDGALMSIEDSEREPTSLSRSTRQRRAIEATMTGFDDFRTAQEIYESLLRQGESVGLATVYRGIQWLLEAGKVDVVTSGSGESRYRRCSETHHHHLVCRECGRTVEIEGPAVEHWAAAVSERFGFVDVNHTVELFGTCTRCREDDA